MWWHGELKNRMRGRQLHSGLVPRAYRNVTRKLFYGHKARSAILLEYSTAIAPIFPRIDKTLQGEKSIDKPGTQMWKNSSNLKPSTQYRASYSATWDGLSQGIPEKEHEE